jgi:hypothetical protein
MSPEEIVSPFPGATLADVHAASASYFDNRTGLKDRSFQTLRQQPHTNSCHFCSFTFLRANLRIFFGSVHSSYSLIFMAAPTFVAPL